MFLSVPKVTESKKQKSHFLFLFFFSYFWINSPFAGTESAQADPVFAVPPLNNVHCRLYTCAGPTRDEYFQLRTTRDENFHQPWRPMLLAQKAVWRSDLVWQAKVFYLFPKSTSIYFTLIYQLLYLYFFWWYLIISPLVYTPTFDVCLQLKVNVAFNK